MDEILLFQTSPHENGVTATIAELLAEHLAKAHIPHKLLSLTKRPIRPCCHCGFCQSHPSSCSLDSANDQAPEMLNALRRAPFLVVFAPIYFYALPANFKALIDRSQRFWQSHQGLETENALPTLVLLHAARSHGDHLFSGALLTLTYFLKMLSRTIEASYTFRGLESVADIPTHIPLANALPSLVSLLSRKYEETLS
ncbi:MAG: flavodoxin family protein [Desulfovibrio sp.]|nr:flavodoxin family protein [Desulfovibrio sp.]